MNSGPAASTIVSERIRSNSTMADELIFQPDRPAISRLCGWRQKNSIEPYQD